MRKALITLKPEAYSWKYHKVSIKQFITKPILVNIGSDGDVYAAFNPELLQYTSKNYQECCWVILHEHQYILIMEKE